MGLESAKRVKNSALHNVNTQKELWNGFWEKFKFGTREDKKVIQQELSSLRWKKIERKIIDKYSSFKGLKVIEVGSGRGEISAIMALKGADITLLDYSEQALGEARSLFARLGLEANYIKCDVMNVSGNVLNKFDISMSFGLAEHFAYPQRQTVFDIHARLLNNKGVSFISVPNIYCLPYRIFMGLSKMLGYCSIGEVPFSRLELKNIASLSSFKSFEIVGSSLIRDSVYFLLARFISHLSKWKVMLGTTKFEIPSILDDYFGYSLIFIGYK